MLSGEQLIPEHSTETRRRAIAPVLWLLPAAFILHDSEELLTMPGWIAGHQRALESLALMSDTSAGVVRSLSTTTSQVAVAIGFILLLIVVATVGATMSQGRGFWLYVYASLLGLLFLHVFTHVAQAIFFGGYVPGLIGAVLVLLPCALYIYKRLLGERLLTWRSAAVTALVGFSLFLPGALLAHQLGRVLGQP